MSSTSKLAAMLCGGLLFTSLAYLPDAARAAAPNVPLTITQQGKLLDNTGMAVNGVAQQFHFALYTAATGGTAIWTEQDTITPDNGYFSVRLGETTPFGASVFDGSRGTLFLGIAIGADSEMTPRQQLTSVPFALLSLNSAHAALADAASGGLDARIAAMETLLACPDATARTNFGFCIWHEDNGITYTLNYFQAANACKAKGGRLCTLAEVSAAQAAGATWCAYSWVADRASNTTGYETLPLQVDTGGCGSAGLNTSGAVPFTSKYDAACCKP